MWLASVLWALKAESTQLVPLAWIRYPVRAWLIMPNWDFCNKRERETQRERESFALSLTEWNRSWFLLLAYLAHVWSSRLLCCLLDTNLKVINIIFHCINISHLVSERTLLSGGNKQQKKIEKKSYPGWEKSLGQQHLLFQKMATQSDTSVEIQKFNGKNFTLWKQMM